MTGTEQGRAAATLTEMRRLEVLRDYRILDSPEEETFDNIARLACKAFRAPIALVSLIDRDRQWFKAHIGISTQETPREYAFCEYAAHADVPFVVPDARLDARFSANPLVRGDPHIRFYCGVPLRTPARDFLGTLCVIDRTPRSAAAAELSTLKLLGRQVELELEIRKRLVMVDEGLQNCQEQQRNSQSLAAMLVHDFRNPLTAATLLGAMLHVEDPDSVAMRAAMLTELERLQRMVTDVLDLYLDKFGRLIPRLAEVAIGDLMRGTARRLSQAAEQHGQELMVQAPNILRAHADPQLLARVLENLVSNAMKHGPPNRPITVAARANGELGVRVEVSDQGTPIPPSLRRRMFDVFASGADFREPVRHFGLGLAFCRIALRAQGASLDVESTADGNCFFFDLPSSGPA